MSTPNPRLATLLNQLPAMSDGLQRVAGDLDAGRAKAHWTNSCKRIESAWRGREIAAVWIGDAWWATNNSAPVTWYGANVSRAVTLDEWTGGQGLLHLLDGANSLRRPFSFGNLVHHAAVVILFEPAADDLDLWKAELEPFGIPLLQAVRVGTTPHAGTSLWRLPEAVAPNPLSLFDSAFPDAIRQVLVLRAYVDQLHDFGRAAGQHVDQELARLDARLMLLTGPRVPEVDPSDGLYRKEQLARLKAELEERVKGIDRDLRDDFAEDELEFVPSFRNLLSGLSHDAKTGAFEEEVQSTYLDRLGLGGVAHAVGGQYKVKLRLKLDMREGLRAEVAQIIRKRLKVHGDFPAKRVRSDLGELKAQSKILGIEVPEWTNAESVESERELIDHQLKATFDLKVHRLEFDVTRAGFFGAIMRARVAATSVLMMAMLVGSGLGLGRPPAATVKTVVLGMLGLLIVWRWLTKPIEEDELRKQKTNELRVALEELVNKAAWDVMKVRLQSLSALLARYAQAWKSAIEREEKALTAALSANVQRAQIDQTEKHIIERNKAGLKAPPTPSAASLKVQIEVRAVCADAVRNGVGGRP